MEVENMYDLVDLNTKKIIVSRQMTLESVYEKNRLFRKEDLPIRWIKDYNSIFEKTLENLKENKQ